jgi:hypothetical protein
MIDHGSERKCAVPRCDHLHTTLPGFFAISISPMEACIFFPDQALMEIVNVFERGLEGGACAASPR